MVVNDGSKKEIKSMADKPYPFKANSGVPDSDLKRGHCPGEKETQPEEEDMYALPPEETEGGFLGRPKGWER
jgi:hypothetical protein